VPIRHEPQDLEAMTAELTHDSPRAAIIVGASVLDYALEELIKSRLREPKSSDEENELFSETGVFNSFRKKISMAYFMRLIGPTARKDFELIRRIRNEVAHNMNPVSFELDTIANRCRELVFAKESIPGKQTPPDLRGKFTFSIHVYVGLLMMRATDHLPGVREALEHVSKYLDN
jgi:hypothetical protein